MNKQELIEHIGNTLDKYLKNTTFVKPVLSITEIAKSDEVSLEFEIGKSCILLDDVSYRFGYDKGKLDGEWVGQQLKDADKIRKELNKPVVPQFVADWIEYFKNCKGTLYGSTNPFSYYGRAILEDFEGDCEEVLRWIRDNSDTYARAWLDGYTVEEKRYRVSLKNGQPLLKAFLGEALYFSQDIAIERYEVTRKQLEEAGFGWVFDCPGIEIEEVEE